MVVSQMCKEVLEYADGRNMLCAAFNYNQEVSFCITSAEYGT